MKKFPAGVQLKAMGNMLLLELIGKDAKTPGGILLPDSAQKDLQREGIVRGVGPMVPKEHADLFEDGTRVLIGYAGDEFTLDDVVHVLVNQAQVQAILTGDFAADEAAHDTTEPIPEPLVTAREPVPEATPGGKIELPGV